jgi:hypothetical protein
MGNRNFIQREMLRLRFQLKLRNCLSTLFGRAFSKPHR